MHAKLHFFCKLFVAAVVFCWVLFPSFIITGQPASPHVHLGIVSDWTHHHLLFPDSKDVFVRARIQNDPRWVQDWYNRHPEAWWPKRHPKYRVPIEGSRRDWSVPLVATGSTVAFEPIFENNLTFAIGSDTGNVALASSTNQGSGVLLATAATLTVMGTSDNGYLGTYSLVPGGPGVTTSPDGKFNYDNLIYPSDPALDVEGLLFNNSDDSIEINIWGNSPDNYSFYVWDNSTGSYYLADTVQGSATVAYGPGGGQTSPAKFVFDVTAAPSCTNDYVVIGIPANPVSGGQANIIGVNNLYTAPDGSGVCPGTGPTVMFAYASGSGQVPADVAISQDGTQIVYVENLPTSSYFHLLTLGTTGNNGASPTAAVVPGTGNNAVDQRLLLSPDSGITTQSSTNVPFVAYTHNDAYDWAYVTTYSTAGSGSGYLYKISNVFNGSATPTIVWSATINAIPSTPVYDFVSNKVFFTDSNGRIDYVADSGPSPTVVYGAVVASGTTSENPVIVDITNEMVYASFNSNGTNAIVVQAPTSMASSVSVPVGTETTAYTGPYSVDFNNAWYTGSGTPLMYVAGTGATGTLPTLYSVGFNGSGVMNTSPNTTAALATGTADSSPVIEFYNASLNKDYLFVGVTNNCIATIGGGTAGCVMSLDITNGFPTVNAGTTALPAAGGTTAIIVDNDSSLTEASSIYYATKTGVTLVKATQSGLN